VVPDWYPKGALFGHRRTPKKAKIAKKVVALALWGEYYNSLGYED
jgi:hypothetical protein